MKRAAYHCAYIVPACNVDPLSCRYCWANGPPTFAAAAAAAPAAGGLFEGGYRPAHAAGEASRMDGHTLDSAHVAGLGHGRGRVPGLGPDAREPLVTDPDRTGSRREREQQ